jgi:hypothetical protein
MASSKVAVNVGVKRKHSQVSDLRQFVCDSPGCKKAYTSEGYFKRHLLIHSDENTPPASHEGWRQHYKYRHIFGLPDGRVWNCTAGRFLEGTKLSGYVQLRISGNPILRHRLNFEIAAGRAIRPKMEIDHIIVPPKPADGSEPLPQDDSWANLQELKPEEHRRKTSADNPGAGKMGGITKGFPGDRTSR